MPTLVLVRHAQAATPYPDHLRPLTDAGRDQAERLGRTLAREIGSFDVAVSSDATRARQTFEAIAGHVGVGSAWMDRSIYDADEGDIITLARSLSGASALIVGHEPTVSLAAEILSRHEDRAAVARGVATATAMVLTFDGPWDCLGPGSCSMRLFLTPPAGREGGPMRR